MAYDTDLAGRVRGALVRATARTAPHREIKMFGGVCFTVGGHICCGVAGDDLVVRVRPRRLRDALLSHTPDRWTSPAAPSEASSTSPPPAAAVHAGFDRYEQEMATLAGRIARLRETPVTDARAKEPIYDAVAADVVPARLLRPVHSYYFDPTDDRPDCAPRTLWGLRLFGMAGGLANSLHAPWPRRPGCLPSTAVLAAGDRREGRPPQGGAR